MADGWFVTSPTKDGKSIPIIGWHVAGLFVYPMTPVGILKTGKMKSPFGLDYEIGAKPDDQTV